MVVDFIQALEQKKRRVRAPEGAKRAPLMIRLEFGSIRMTITLGKQARMDLGNYNPTKAAQMIAYFALKAGEQTIDLLKAMKLIYLSDRDSIGRWGAPILSEPRVAMKFGPVNDLTYSFAKGERRDPEGWSRVLGKTQQVGKQKVIPLADGIDFAALDELSEADCESMDAVWSQVGFMSQFALAGWTHKDGNVPEWEDPHGSSRPIPLEKIMREVGIENAAQAAAEFEGHRSIGAILRGSDAR